MRCYLGILLAAAEAMRCDRVRRLSESPAAAAALTSSSVDARGGDARVTRRGGKASTSSGTVPGKTGVSETGVRSGCVGYNSKFASVYAPISRFISLSAEMISSCVVSADSGGIRSAELRLGASITPLADAVELVDLPLGAAADAGADELDAVPLGPAIDAESGAAALNSV